MTPSAHRLARVEPDLPSTATRIIPTGTLCRRGADFRTRLGRLIALLLTADGRSVSAPMFLLGPTGGPLWTFRSGRG